MNAQFTLSDRAVIIPTIFFVEESMVSKKDRNKSRFRAIASHRGTRRMFLKETYQKMGKHLAGASMCNRERKEKSAKFLEFPIKFVFLCDTDLINHTKQFWNDNVCGTKTSIRKPLFLLN